MGLPLDPLRTAAASAGIVTWSGSIAVDGQVVDELDPARVAPTASIGKLFLLVAVAELFATGELDPAATVVPRPDLAVADSGLLQHLNGKAQRLDDLAAMVGAVSDNLATNVLLDLVGHEPVAAAARRLGAADCALHDFVRDRRRRGIDPPRLSSGTAGQLCSVIAQLVAASASDPALVQVRRWLRLNTDLSMVASAFGLDPLAHGGADGGVTLVNKTGTNDDVRADVGVVAAERAVAYAVIAHFTDGGAADLVERRRALAAMRAVGDVLLELARR